MTTTTAATTTSTTAPEPLLAVDGLSVAVASGARALVVDGVSLTVAPGECVGVVGESGSGKSLTMRAVAGLLPEGLDVTKGTVRLGGEEVLGLAPRARAALRGRRIALLMQDPFAMLHPQLTCGRQIADGLRGQGGRGRAVRAARRAEVERRLAEVGLEPSVADRYPHELSGGMLQRVATAAALAGDPDLLIADEPTTALDTATQAAVLDLLGRLRRERAMGLVLITHDLRVAFSACDRVHVLYAGTVVEHGPSHALRTAPRHPYTAALLASEPSARERRPRLTAVPGSVPAPGERGPGCPFADRCAFTAPACRTTPVALVPLAPATAGGAGTPAPRASASATDPGTSAPDPGLSGPHAADAGGRATACLRAAGLGPLDPPAGEAAADGAAGTGPETDDAALVVSDVGRRFGSAAGDRQVLADVSLTVPAGEVTALVGRSGSGKTTLARIAIGLETFDSGTVRTGPVDLPPGRRPSTADRRRLAGHAQIVFQDPYASLSPLRTVGATLREALDAARRGGRGDGAETVESLLAKVGLPERYAARRPAALSGGERQRVAVARALAARPRLLICDEAVAALDVSVQAQLLNLLDELRRDQGFAVLFITHDLAVVRQIADHVAVLHDGRIVETGPAARVLDAPGHPETRRLLAAVPAPR
ncbi:ABC transporter ATP-binding protein [Streptomyces abyssomicinicus]|uniref:ABC transporter ATP-binding protein n=1 Tax=Streptomyces abyssomicinicus TaxID=574929 RepID=UPI0012508AF7|nr:dipeptide ABC transporter ATP-binding protein [Streptomyces abyssomicinicus]